MIPISVLRKVKPIKSKRAGVFWRLLTFLCRLPQPLIHHIGHSGNKLPIGGLPFFSADGIAEIAVQSVPVASGPGYLHQVPDGPFHPGSGGVEDDRQLGVEAICWNIYGINVLLFIGLYSL